MNLEKLEKYRRDLHQIPEIAFDLFLTSAYVKNELEQMGYQTETVAKTGLVAIKKGISKNAIAFRSDMDALSVTEKTKVSYQSLHPSKMHACGHDGHMAILLGFADYVSKLEKQQQSIVFIFQPAEEGPGGAKVIIEEKILEKYHIKHIFGLHLYPGLAEGKYGLVDGPMLAQNGEFNLTITGKSSHAAQPHFGHDAILAVSELIGMYHKIVSRFINPLDHAVITVGTIEGGEARNIIANQAMITGTIRSFKESVYQNLKKSMRKIDHAIEIAFDVKVENNIMDYYPPVVNDHELFLRLKNNLDKTQYELIPPMMFAEDFAFYQKEVPGLFVMLGTRNNEKEFIHPLHSCYFNFDEKVLLQGVELYKKILKMMEL
ncbi:MAG: amidohydrolase [Acholeplasmataceae bacterium]|nr:amidohydrolase [Acholeplasmataceae bacterium]